MSWPDAAAKPARRESARGDVALRAATLPRAGTEAVTLIKLRHRTPPCAGRKTGDSGPAIERASTTRNVATLLNLISGNAISKNPEFEMKFLQ